MKPIISPWLIYFASRADNLTTFFGVIEGTDSKEVFKWQNI